MSQTIDERVVEMRFDNKQFENGVKESLSTLDKLKEALNLEKSAKSFEALDKAANSVSLSGIAAGIEALEKRFSTLGIVGMRVIENITDSLMNMASSAMSYVNDAIISGGLRRAQNIENAHFQLQALLKDEEAVQAVMDNAMQSVDGTAYAYDEAAKAASQFAASGMKAGEEMLGSLRAITGVAAMTNSEYEGISRIFTTVAGNGRLMGDQLLQLASRGLNAAATIADYFREVQGQAKITESDIREMVSDGQISFEIFAAAMDWAFGESAFRANETFTGALSNMKSALARIGAGFFSPLIEQNSDLIMLINVVRERINDVKKGLVFDEQTSAISGLAKATGLETDALKEMFNTIDQNGSVSSKNLTDLSKNGVDATKTLTNYINGVTDGTIRASYATKTALGELTGGLQVSESQVRKFVEEGKIDLSTFTSAMETAYGDQKALSKQFTDSVLNMAKSISEYLQNLDLSKPLAVVYYGIETIKNLFNGLYSILKPIGQAFADVFLSFNMDDVINLADRIETLTSKLKLSEEGSQNLRYAFEGVFNVIKLVIDGITGLIGVVIPVGKPIGSLTDMVLSLVGAMGKGLTSFTEWINKSTLLNKAYSVVAEGIQTVMTKVSGFISSLDEFVDYIYNLPITQKIINGVIESFSNLYTKGKEGLTALIQKLKEFGSRVSEMIPENAQNLFEQFSKTLSNLGENFEGLNLTKVSELFGKLTGKLKELLDVLKGNEGIGTFITNMKNYFRQMTDAFSFDTLFHNIETFKELVGGFVEWFRKTISPAFQDFSIGGAVAGAGGIGIIYAVIQGFKAFEKIGQSLNALPESLSAIKGTLVAYQKDLKADALLKIAKAIAVLAVAITVLSFADMEKVYLATIALSAIGTGLVLAVGYLLDAAKKGATLETAVNNLAKGLTRSLNNLAKAVKWKAIGSAIKDMGIAIGIIVGTIVVLAIAYSKDSENINKALVLVAEIAAAMVGLITIMSVLGTKLNAGMKAFAAAATGVLALSASLLVVMTALNKLFKMEIPADWEARMEILKNIFGELAVLTLTVGVAARIAGADANKSLATPILALAAALYLSVAALNKVFKMDLPSDYEDKLAILAGIFTGLIVAILAIGVASRLANNNLKLTGALLAMCAVIATIVGSLMVLSIFPEDKLFSGAVALGMTLFALGIALSGAGRIISAETWKSVLAMSMEIGAITAALGVLSMISGENLLKGATALGAILLVLATDFLAVSKITSDLAYASILAMAANVGVIAVSLYVLAEQPWEGLLSAAVSLGVVLTAVAGAFLIISKAQVDNQKILAFLGGSIGVIMAAMALGYLAEYPWSGMLSAAASLSAVLLAVAGSFRIMSSAKPDLGTLAGFIGGLIAIGVVAYVIAELASQPWDGMLAAAASISMVLIALAEAMKLCTTAGNHAKGAVLGIALLDIFIADLAVVVYALGRLSDKTKEFLEKGGEILMNLGTYLGKFFGNILGGIVKGVTDVLPAVGQDLSDFADNAQTFFDIMGGLDAGVLTGAKNLAETILILTKAELLSGIASFLLGGTDFSKFGEQLTDFGKGIANFASEVKGINGADVEAASYCAKTLAELYSNMPKEDGWMQKITGQQKTLAEFAEELIPFGSALVEYSNTVSGNIDQSAVEASIKAAEVLKAFADTLPDMGGLKSLIFGQQKTLAEFAEELIPFGSALVEYSGTVGGNVDQSAVEASIQAAEVLKAFADTLPDMGGLAGIIFGNQKTLAEFAEELIPFGSAMVEYSNAVSGNIDEAAVTASANAAMTLAELQNALGDSGGIISWFTGDNTLDDFGKQLAKLGEGIAAYSESVSTVNPTQMAAVIAEVWDLVELANSTSTLDTSGMSGFSDSLKTMANNGITGFIESFTGSISNVKNTVMSFMTNAETQVTTSGKSMTATSQTTGETVASSFQNGFKSKEPNILNTIKDSCTQVITKMKDTLPSTTFNSIGQGVVNDEISGLNAKKSSLLSKVQDLCASSISQMKTSLPTETFNAIGQRVVNDEIVGLNDKRGSLLSTVTELCASSIYQMKTSLPTETFNAIGQRVVNDEISGLNAKRPHLLNTVQDICNNTAYQMALGLPSSTFSNLGEGVTAGLSVGIQNQSHSAIQAARDVSSSVLQGFQNNLTYSDMHAIGSYAAEGLGGGISSKISSIKDAAISAARSAINAAKAALEISSPSKVFHQIGEFVSEGLAEGIVDNLAAVSDATGTMADESIDTMNDVVQKLSKMIDEDPDFEPTITPVVDLSNVEQAVNDISALFQQFSISSAYEKALEISGSFARRKKQASDDQDLEEGELDGKRVYIMNQNNYSPKSLSRSEIYRQTKNLFSRLEEVTGGA